MATYRHAMACSIINDIRQHPFSVAHDDEHCQVYLKPILSPVVIYLYLQLLYHFVFKRKK